MWFACLILVLIRYNDTINCCYWWSFQLLTFVTNLMPFLFMGYAFSNKNTHLELSFNHLVHDTNSWGMILPTTFFILLLHHSFSIQTHSDFEPNPFHSALHKLATFSLLIQSIFWIFIQVQKNLWRSILNLCANGFTSGCHMYFVDLRHYT